MKSADLLIQRLLGLLLIAGFFHSLKAQWRTELHQVGLYGGSSLIANSAPAVTVEVAYEYLTTACSHDEYNGFAVRFDRINPSHYAWSARYFSQIIDMPSLAFAPFWSIGGGEWIRNEARSVFVRPALGFRSSSYSWLFWRRRLPKSSLNFHLSYAYMYALNSTEKYFKSPHEITLMLGWSQHLRWFPINTRLFKTRSMRKDAKHWGR